jgi:hypothetical protein
MAVRILLKKKWTNFQGKEYAVGTILQLTKQLASQLIADKIGDYYKGEYPPKKKFKIELSTLTK